MVICVTPEKHTSSSIFRVSALGLPAVWIRVKGLDLYSNYSSLIQLGINAWIRDSRCRPKVSQES